MTALRTRLPLAAAALGLASASASAQIQLNEIYASHGGSDTQEMIEVKGPPGASLDNLVVCIIEGEPSSAPSCNATNRGVLDRAWDLTGYTIPASGYFVMANTGVTPKDYDLGGNQDRIENGAETFYIVDCTAGGTAALVGALGTDLDPEDDGTSTLSGFGTFVDYVAMVDTDACTDPDLVYDGATAIGPDGTFFPAGIYRGGDANWCDQDFLDFDQNANANQPRTPGAPNGICPSAPTVVTYCTAGTTTNLCNASIGAVGVPSVSATSGFTVIVSGVEGARQGILFYGISGQVALPWGTSSSFICVAQPYNRMGQQDSGGTDGGCDGVLQNDVLDYLANNPGALGQPFQAGDQAWFQGWFRDPPSPKTTMLSNGLEVTFAP
jgi:hypothetical protein